MAKTEVKTRDIGDGEVKRQDLNVSESGSAVTRRIIAGDGITIVSTGVDSGTGDVTVRGKHKISIRLSIPGNAGNSFLESPGGLVSSDSAFMFDRTYFLKKVFLSGSITRPATNLVRVRSFSLPDSNLANISTADQNDWNAASTDAQTVKLLGGGKHLIWIATNETLQVVPNRRYGFYLEVGQNLRNVVVELEFQEVVP